MKNEKLLGAIARGYCHPKNSSKVFDVDLCVAIAQEIVDLLKSENVNLTNTDEKLIRKLFVKNIIKKINAIIYFV